MDVSNRTPPPDNALRKFFGRREPCPAENTAVRVRRYGTGTGGVGGYGAWLVSKKLLKYREFTGSGDVWGEGSVRKDHLKNLWERFSGSL